MNVSDVNTYKEYKYFNNLFFKRASKKIIEKTEFKAISMTVIKRVKKKAHLLKINYILN